MWERLVEFGLVVYVIGPILLTIPIGIIWFVCVVAAAIKNRNEEL